MFYLSFCSYYNLDNTDFNVVNKFLSTLVEKSIVELEASHCIQVGDVGFSFSFVRHSRRTKKSVDIMSTKLELFWILRECKYHAN